MGGTARRVTLSHVFVELPPSRTSLKHLPHVSSAGHKENALSRSSASQMNSSTPPAPADNKRKLDVDASVADEPAPKKHKQPKDSMTQSVANATDEYPNGFVYCHQCNKKRDATGPSRFLPQFMYSRRLQSLSAAPQKTARDAGATPNTASHASRTATVFFSKTSSPMAKQTRITMSTGRAIISGNHSVNPAECHRSRTCHKVPTMR